MVKLFVREEKLYVERAGKEKQLESATIYHYQKSGIYEIIVFTRVDNKRFVYKQKTYPLVKIKFSFVRTTNIMRGDQYKKYLNVSGKHYYINYYVVD